MNQVAILLKLRLETERVGVAAIARKCGINPSNMHKCLDETANPQLHTLLKIADAVGLELYWREKT